MMTITTSAAVTMSRFWQTRIAQFYCHPTINCSSYVTTRSLTDMGTRRLYDIRQYGNKALVDYIQLSSVQLDIEQYFGCTDGI